MLVGVCGDGGEYVNSLLRKEVLTMARAISKDFLNDLKNGKLSSLLKRVLADDTLDLELRGKCINIYYRGGSLFRITEKGSRTYEIFFDLNYCDTEAWRNTGIIVICNPTIQQAVKDIPYYKQAMDMWLHKNPKYERECQQLLVRENNNQGDISKSTDYYILDIEYTDDSDRSKSRFDIVALKWESKSWIRKDNGKCSVVLMEMKYGDNALDGAAGIEKHLEDFKNFFAKPVYELKEIYKDWEKVFKQKCELGLVDGLQEKQYDVKIKFNEPENELENKPEVALIFANHDPDKTKLGDVLSKINCNNYKFNILIANASNVGYGLYVDKMRDVTEYQA